MLRSGRNILRLLIVEDEKELDAVIRIFDELLEDVNLEV